MLGIIYRNMPTTTCLYFISFVRSPPTSVSSFVSINATTSRAARTAVFATCTLRSSGKKKKTKKKNLLPSCFLSRLHHHDW